MNRQNLQLTPRVCEAENQSVSTAVEGAKEVPAVDVDSLCRNQAVSDENRKCKASVCAHVKMADKSLLLKVSEIHQHRAHSSVLVLVDVNHAWRVVVPCNEVVSHRLELQWRLHNTWQSATRGKLNKNKAGARGMWPVWQQQQR